MAQTERGLNVLVSYRASASRAWRGPAWVYELAGQPRFCCDEMKGEWGVLVGFGVQGCPRTSSREVNLFSLHPQSTGSVISGITEIRFCPWCGECIETRPAK